MEDYKKYGHTCRKEVLMRKIEKDNEIQKTKEEQMKNEIEVVSQKDIAPTLIGTLSETERRYKELQEFIQKQMVEGEDYGKIPGCPKPSLFKAGAEKLLEIYGYSVSDIQVINKVENWEKGFFHYEIKAVGTSKRSGQIIGTGIGSCNSKEKKYINQDPFTIVNTIQKMAKKRAVVDLALLVSRSSGIFTQDIEDMDIVQAKPIPAQVKQEKVKEVVNPDGSQTIYTEEKTVAPKKGTATEKQQKAVYAVLKSAGLSSDEIKEKILADYGVEHTKELSFEQASEIITMYRNK